MILGVPLLCEYAGGMTDQKYTKSETRQSVFNKPSSDGDWYRHSWTSGRGGWGVGGRKHAFPMSHLIQLGFIAFRCFKSRAIQPVAC